jgi:hypothetical protein
MKRHLIISNLTASNSDAVVELLRAYELEYHEPDNYRITVALEQISWDQYRSFVADIVMNTSASIQQDVDFLSPEFDAFTDVDGNEWEGICH